MIMAETLKIKDLPTESRPREAFMHSANPAEDIADDILLAIMIRTGQRGSSAIDLAHRLLNHFGGIEALIEATWQQIEAAKITGLGPVAAVQIAAAFTLARRHLHVPYVNVEKPIETSDDAVSLVKKELTNGKQEQTFAIYLNTQRHILCRPVEIAKGTANATFLHPRDIFAKALSLGAVSLIVVHTHPSGDATPSAEDIKETERLKAAGNVMGVPLDDHIVIGCGTDHYVSIRGLGNHLFNDARGTAVNDSEAR